MFKKTPKLFQNSSSFAVDLSLIKASVTFLSNIFRTYLLNSDAKRGPLFVSWLATYRCNANCHFCSTHELSRKFPDGVSLKRSLEIAHEIGRAKTWVAGFTGGEVFLWPHLFPVIKVLKQYKVNVYIITNGRLLKENAEKIIESGVDSVVVSIDSDFKKEHDDNRRVTGLYDSLTEGIERLKKLRKNKKPIIKSMTVLTKKNYPKIEKIITRLSEIVDVMSIQPVVSGYENAPHSISREEQANFFLKTEEELAVEKAILELAARHKSFDNFYFKNIPAFWFHPEKLLKVKCWAPFLRLSIMPTGETVFCGANSRYSSSLGNLNNQSLMAAWNSPKMKSAREEIRRHKNNCVCWTQDASFNAFMHRLPLVKHLPVLGRKIKSKR